jgi:hypothetical protein
MRATAEGVVETMSEEEEPGGRHEIKIPLPGEHMKQVLDVGGFHGPGEAAEVKHVVGYQPG